MSSEPRDGFVQRRILLAKTKTYEVARAVVQIERADGHRGHTGLHRDMAAEIFVGAVEAERPEVGIQKVSPRALGCFETDARQPLL